RKADAIRRLLSFFIRLALDPWRRLEYATAVIGMPAVAITVWVAGASLVSAFFVSPPFSSWGSKIRYNEYFLLSYGTIFSLFVGYFPYLSI
ncbi:MAG: hypothetical protein ACOYKJ_06210, partial [Candidatus Howiella sp.]